MVQVNLVGIPQMHAQGRIMMNVDVALPILVSKYIVVVILHEIEVLLVLCICIDVVALGSMSKANQATWGP